MLSLLDVIERDFSMSIYYDDLNLGSDTDLKNINSLFQSSAYLYDDLHSLDNDSFLTSLETISEKDKFNWE